MIWQVTGGEGELEWPSPPSFVLPSLPTPSTQPPPPYLPYLPNLPKDTGHGASALTNRPVDYPALYTATHQDPRPLNSFPSSLEDGDNGLGDGPSDRPDAGEELPVE